MNAYITDQFTCVCVPGFRQGSNGCVATSTNNCPRQNEQWNGSSCVC